MTKKVCISASALFLLIGMTVLLTGCESHYDWGWHILDPRLKSGRQNLLFLLDGYAYTLSLTLISMVFSIALGLMIALLQSLKIKQIQFVTYLYLAFFRAVPLLVLILWIYYGLPVVSGISLSPFVASVLALALADAAFEAEVFRSGIQSVPRGQLDAANALGLSFFQRFRLIILPQAIRVILPTLVNQFVYMLKMSSLASFIGLTDLTRLATELVVIAYRPLEIYTFLIFEYLVLILIAMRFANWVEKKYCADNQKHDV